MLKFGFGGVPSHGLQDAIDLARLGESLGYDRLWVPDQTFYRDPFLVISVIAQATSRIQLMLGVTNPFTRHPVQIARAAATLAEISADRFAVGYGAGNRKQLILPLGMEQEQVSQRCREAVVITRRLLAGEEVTHHSSTLHLEKVRLLTETKPALPLYLAGRGPAVLKAAGEVADGAVIGGLVSEAGIQYARRQIEAGVERRAQGLDEVAWLSWVTCHVTDDTPAVLNRVRPNVAHIIGGAPKSVLLAIGFEEPRIDELKRHYGAQGPEGTAHLVEDGEVQLLTIVGDADTCATRIEQLAAAGIQEFGFLLTQPSPQEQAEFVRRFASEVMPAFR